MASEHKRTANALRESEERFRLLFDNMSSGVAVYEAVEDGEDFLFKDFNKAAQRIEDIHKDELIGKSVSSLFPGVVEFGLLKVFQRVWRTGVPEYYPIQFYKDERIAGWRENNVYKLLSGEIVAIFDDFTQRKQMEDELKQSENRYRSIVGVIPDLIIKLDRDGVYLDIISQSDELLFMPREKVLGQKMADILPEAVVASGMEALRKCLDEQVLQVVEYELQVPAGKKYFESRSVPLNENSAYALVRDVTDQKRAEIEKEKLIEELQNALGQVKTLSGLLPICSACKKIRDDQGYWSQIEAYIGSRSEAEFSHSICPECAKTLYPDYYNGPDLGR
jgi:PAS domain S-box-containing protein